MVHLRTIVCAAFALALGLPGPVDAQGGARKRRPLPHEFGQVVMDNGSTASRLPPVVFDHWLHRARFTCRLCHVDLGFGMSPGATRVKASDNLAGYYCGACHDGKRTFEGRTLFPSCAKQQPGAQVRDACLRCHSLGKDVKAQADFAAVTRKLPRGRFGNGVDWEKAEEDGLVKPLDFLEGVSIRRPSMPAQKDFALSPKLAGMPEIIFSHAKHTRWNGCELCHPDIFVGVKQGMTKYSMADIFAGRYCGVCHVNVAFPMTDCRRCHVKAVQ